MPESVMFHEGNRRLQDRFDSRRISDRLEEKLTRKEFTADDKTFVEGLPYFFLATSDDQGRPDCSFKGGPPGFVRVTGPSEIAFPDYDGNGMFKSLGNISVNANVGLLFIAMHGKPRRLRVNGSAGVSDRDPLLSETVGARLPSAPKSGEPVIVVELADGTNPFSSPNTRNGLRVGTAAPTPQRKAPLGPSKPSATPRNS